MHTSRCAGVFRVQVLLDGGARVQHLADYIRAVAISQTGGGWFVDADTIWLRPLPALQVCDESLGHWFASMPAAGKQGATKAEVARYWRVHFLREPGDQVYLASPMAFASDSPLLKVGACRIRLLPLSETASGVPPCRFL